MNPSDHGRFCWYDLMTTDPIGSRRFYAELFGWHTETVPMGEHQYEMLYQGDRPLGGIVAMDAKEGIPTYWIPYVAVSDIARTCDLALGLGAVVCVPPTDLGPGIFAVVTDPQGGVFSPWQSKQELPPAPGKSDLGLFCWSECLSTDANSGAEFYRQLFGWKVEDRPMEIGGRDTIYRLFYQNDHHHAGILDLPAESVSQGARTHWLNYVSVEDVDAAADKASALGAALLCTATDIPRTGRFCVIQDPQGGMISLFRHFEKESE